MNGHYRIDRQKWAKLSLLEQMGNIGSEVGRSIKAKQNGDQAAWQAALERTLDLFDATTDELVKFKSLRSKEVFRAKDQYLQLFYNPASVEADSQKLEKYFIQLAIAARSQPSAVSGARDR